VINLTLLLAITSPRQASENCMGVMVLGTLIEADNPNRIGALGGRFPVPSISLSSLSHLNSRGVEQTIGLGGTVSEGVP